MVSGNVGDCAMYINGKYYTESELAAIKRQLNNSDFEKFLVSGVIGAVTGSTIIGGLLGDTLEGTDDSWL